MSFGGLLVDEELVAETENLCKQGLLISNEKAVSCNFM